MRTTRMFPAFSTAFVLLFFVLSSQSAFAQTMLKAGPAELHYHITGVSNLRVTNDNVQQYAVEATVQPGQTVTLTIFGNYESAIARQGYGNNPTQGTIRIGRRPSLTFEPDSTSDTLTETIVMESRRQSLDGEVRAHWRNAFGGHGVSARLTVNLIPAEDEHVVPVSEVKIERCPGISRDHILSRRRSARWQMQARVNPDDATNKNVRWDLREEDRRYASIDESTGALTIPNIFFQADRIVVTAYSEDNHTILDRCIIRPAEEYVPDPEKVDTGARFTDFGGEVGVIPDEGRGIWKPAELGMVLYEGDVIVTGEDSEAHLAFADMSSFVVSPESEVILKAPPGPESKLRLVLGDIWYNVKRMMTRGQMDVTMNQAMAGGRGTIYHLRETGDRSMLWVYEGQVEMRHRHSGESLLVEKGQATVATKDSLSLSVFARDPEADRIIALLRQEDPARPAPAVFTVEAAKRNVPQGGSVTVPVSLNNVDALANMNVNIHYDPSVIRPARNAARGNIIPQSLFEANVRDRGVVRLGFAQREDIRGTGTLAQIPFEAVGRAGARSPLRVEVTMASAAAGDLVTPAQLIHGEVVVVGADGRVPGDTTGRGTLTAADAMNALKMSVGNMPVDMNADIDEDGQVTALDATLILQRVVGR